MSSRMETLRAIFLTAGATHLLHTLFTIEEMTRAVFGREFFVQGLLLTLYWLVESARILWKAQQVGKPRLEPVTADREHGRRENFRQAA